MQMEAHSTQRGYLVICWWMHCSEVKLSICVSMFLCVCLAAFVPSMELFVCVHRLFIFLVEFMLLAMIWKATVLF